ncbi:NIPSNAP family protein [Phenylobacterium sp. J426]|uniref:NIPSNAP family protein n=1 Tax=Phenylobacterium sp. J426 TaxID=2898439 RepID=UPI00215177F6|nr:NIPSNAP family protein [Phenylobacterium sp. J426]MCR5875448.1 NIPSNAP family protein [Phenylobacterium sp. J426]
MWEAKAENRTEFVYLLRWRDEAEMKAAWTAFMADPQWAEIKGMTAAEHGKLVGEIEDRVLIATDYGRTSD